MTHRLPSWIRTIFDWVAMVIPMILLSGCATAPVEPPVRTITVNVPVPAACVPDTVVREAPVYPDTDEALRSAVDAAERYLLVFAGRELRQARLNTLEPTVEGCRAQ